MKDYYPFGMLMPGRNFSSEGYRFGFQNQEKDDEIKGDGNSVNYKYRVHDSRLGRFLSIDPLAPSYPWNSPYAFSENRVIDGVELEGLEYLNKNEARVEFYHGSIVLKLENFSTVYQRRFKEDHPFNYGLMFPQSDGTYRGPGVLGSFIAPSLSEKPPVARGANIGKENFVNNIYNSKLKRNIGKGGLAVNLFNVAAYLYIEVTMLKDNGALSSQIGGKVVHDKERSTFLKYQTKRIPGPVKSTVLDLVEARKMGLIKDDYWNTEDLSAIANVVLFGETGIRGGNNDLYQIGLKILKEVSGILKPEFKFQFNEDSGRFKYEEIPIEKRSDPSGRKE